MISPRRICFLGIFGREGVGEWERFGVEDCIAGDFFFEACSEDGGIHAQAACPEEEEGGLVPAGQFFEGRSGSLVERLRHGRLSGRRPWSEWDFPFPGSG